MMKSIRTILVANALIELLSVSCGTSEMGIHMLFTIYAEEDKFALHRFKADESYCVRLVKSQLQPYLDIKDIIRIAKEAQG